MCVKKNMKFLPSLIISYGSQTSWIVHLEWQSCFWRLRIPVNLWKDQNNSYQVTQVGLVSGPACTKRNHDRTLWNSGNCIGSGAWTACSLTRVIEISIESVVGSRPKPLSAGWSSSGSSQSTDFIPTLAKNSCNSCCIVLAWEMAAAACCCNSNTCMGKEHRAAAAALFALPAKTHAKTSSSCTCCWWEATLNTWNLSLHSAISSVNCPHKSWSGFVGCGTYRCSMILLQRLTTTALSLQTLIKPGCLFPSLMAAITARISALRMVCHCPGTVPCATVWNCMLMWSPTHWVTAHAASLACGMWGMRQLPSVKRSIPPLLPDELTWHKENCGAAWLSACLKSVVDWLSTIHPLSRVQGGISAT